MIVSFFIFFKCKATKNVDRRQNSDILVRLTNISRTVSFFLRLKNNNRLF